MIWMTRVMTIETKMNLVAGVLVMMTMVMNLVAGVVTMMMEMKTKMNLVAARGGTGAFRLRLSHRAATPPFSSRHQVSQTLAVIHYLPPVSIWRQ